MKKETYKSFQDYPTDIQKEAKNILKEGIPLGYFKSILNEKHFGGEEAEELIFFSIASLFISNSKPVHQEIKGDIGSGKTSLMKKILKIVPERYVHVLNNITPEYLYSKRNTFNPDYNIFFLDNINPTKETLSMLKIFTDNEVENKFFIQSEKAELELPGKNLFFCIFTEETNTNISLEDTLLTNINPNSNEIIISDLWRTGIVGFYYESTFSQRKYIVANAIFEKMIEKTVKIFNPYFIGNNYDDNPYKYTQPIDLQRFFNLVKGFRFYHPEKQIGDIIFGNRFEMNIINNLIQRGVIMRDYQLTSKERDLVSLLDIYTDERFEADKNYYNENRDALLTNIKEYRHIPTYDNLAYSLRVSTSMIKQMIKGSPSSLEGKGIAKTMKIDYKKRSSKRLVYIDPEAKNIYGALLRGLTDQLFLADVTKKLFSHKSMRGELLKKFIEINDGKNYKEEIEYISTFLEEEKEELNSSSEIVNYLEKFQERSNQNIKKNN